MAKATVEQAQQIARAAGLRDWKCPSKDVIRAYQGPDYFELVPGHEYHGDEERPSIEVRGKLSRGNGAAKERLRIAGKAIGVAVRG